MIRRLSIVALLIAGSFTAVRAEQIAPREIWPQAASAARDRDLESAKAKTAELVNTGKEYGLKTYPLYATSAAAIARTASAGGSADVVVWAKAAAAQLDPASPTVALALSDAAAAKKDWANAVPLAVKGLTRLFLGYRSSLLSTTNFCIVTLTAIVLTAAIFALALFFRYGRAATHDFREILSTRLRGGSVTVLAFALLFLPIFLWLGPLWLMFYWFFLFFGYATGVEKTIIIVLALLVACVPVALDLAAHWTAGVENPVVMAAISSAEAAYQPEALRRLQDVAGVVPDNAMMQLLLGNLQLFEGNEQQAEVHYRRATEIRDSAGAHVNLGNLHFLRNDFSAAMTEYQKAEKLDPNLAIAFYNDSVASGETYKFDEQGQKLGAAKNIDRALIERYSAQPPSQKIVIYHPTVREAWSVATEVGRRGNARALFGNYSTFDPVTSALNPVTIGALLSIVVAVPLWLRRRRRGFAGQCIKCGRTFCHRCKSSRESATYCTQCIHIYLKRDGVSLDTKRAKLEEVSDYHGSILRRNKLFASFLPGSAQALEGRTLVGTIGCYLFVFFVMFAILVGRLAPIIGPVGETAQMLVRIAAVAIAVILWIALSLPVYRRRTTAA